MKLTVEYDPMAGHICKDGEAQGWVDDVIHSTFYFNKKEDRDDWVITVASTLIIDFFRLRLAEGVVTKDQIAFSFQGEILEHNEFAQIKHWPKGYCDIPIDPVEKLLTVQAKGYKQKKKERAAKITTIVPCKECHEHPCTC